MPKWSNVAVPSWSGRNRIAGIEIKFEDVSPSPRGRVGTLRKAFQLKDHIEVAVPSWSGRNNCV